MPNNNYILTDNGELYHSSECRKTTNAQRKATNSSNKVHVLIHGQIIEVDEDTLMHWKYIKRERRNGKWYYYYQNDYLEGLKYNRDAVKEANEAGRIGFTRKQVEDLTTQYTVTKLFDIPQRIIGVGLATVLNLLGGIFNPGKTEWKTKK
jgi:hypothetical protein